MLQDPDSADALRLRALTAGLKGRNVCVLRQNLDNIYDFAENLPPAWPGHTLLGRSDSDVHPPEIADAIAAAKLRAIAATEADITECESHYEGVRHVFEVQVSPDRRGDALAGTIIVVTDITEQREREMAVASLMREVSHRSKNLLAIVQSVAMQTAHHSDTISDFLRKFRGRLHALSNTQDLVTESDWRGTRLWALAQSQLARLGSGIDSLSVTGDNPMLGPNAAMHVGLALHELATNAVLYGAFSETGPGTIAITCHVVIEDGRPLSLILDWSETHPRLRSVTAPRFGTMVLERIVPLSVGGAASYDVSSDAVHYTLAIPADQFEA